MRYIAYAIVTISVLVSTSMADTSFAVTRAELICPAAGANILEFVIDKSLNPTELIECDEEGEECRTKRKNLEDWISKTLRDPKNYHLMRLDTGAPATLAVLTTSRTSALVNTLRFSVTGHDVSKSYFLVARDVTFEEDKDAAATIPFMIKVSSNSGCTAVPRELPEADKWKPADLSAPQFKEHFSKAAVEDSPRLKVDFSIQGSKKKRVISSFNVNFRPYTTRRIGFGGHYEITPFFLETEYQVNADGADKKDVLNIGIFDTKLLRVFRDDGDEGSNIFFRHAPGILFSITPKLETEWGFRERKLVISPRATLPINVYQSRRSTIRLEPFIGYEYGFQWASVISKPGKNLHRGLFGAGLTTNFFRKNDKPLIAVQIDYIRRVFLKPEYSFAPDPNGKLVPDRETKLPREHGKARLIFNATEFFSPFVECEYGRVPPKYNLINYSFKSGIAFNVDVLWDKFQ